MKPPFRILSIDGGGTRGVIPATLLDALQQTTGQHPTELFDLFAGTSTGGIICIGLAYGLEPAQLVDLYLNLSGKVFHDTRLDDLRDGFGKNFGADYSHQPLQKILTALFGDATLGDVNERLRQQGEKSLMVCCFHLNPEDDGQPINFRPAIYHSNFIRDRDLSLVDLALRTSAGPTYFPIYQNHIDGGVSINHPAMAAVAFAINCNTSEKPEYRYMDGANKGLGKSLHELQVLSLGTGTSNRNRITPEKIRRKRRGDWGNVQWIEYLPDLLTESNVQTSDYYVQQVLKTSGEENQYHRIQLLFDDPGAPEAIRAELARGKVLGLDVCDKRLLRAMHAFAKQYYHEHEIDILSFLKLTDQLAPV
ncbi:MAG: patatin-like phospholipase family protein [Tunicatimonas sp.]